MPMRPFASLALCLCLLTACGPTGNNTPPTGNQDNIPQNGLLEHLSFNAPIENLELAAEYNNISAGPDRFGQADQALVFSGDGSFVKLNIDINPSRYPNLTLGAWVRYTGPADGGIQQVISHDNGEYDRSLGLDNRSGQWGWSAFAGPDGEVLGAADVDGGWVFLLASYEHSSGRMRFFVNDQKFESQATHTEGHTTLHLGANPSFIEHFKGSIDEVYIYERAFSDAEAQQLYMSTRP
ncbi:MAG: LamG domain-containing protein [Candidatus Sericytochromatia bacterium]|nr:LamG domain-containing protein [Candidatus Sericytochromatia bacterium]